VDLKPTAALIIDEAHLPEPVHEKTDSRASCTNHFSEGLLANVWDYSVLLTVFSEMSEQQQNPCQSFLTRIEKLINQIFFVSDVPC
jgi:hypothetical protein